MRREQETPDAAVSMLTPCRSDQADRARSWRDVLLVWPHPPAQLMPVDDGASRPLAPAAGGDAATSLRVCHVISSFYPVVGGAEVATQTLVSALRARGNDVVVLTRRYTRESARFEHVEGIPVYRLGRPGAGKLNALTFGLEALALLVGRMRDRRILHVQNIDSPMLVGLVASVILRRRLFATIHGETQIEGRTRNLRGRSRTSLMARQTVAFTSINPANTAALRRIGVASERIHEIPNGVDMDRYRPPTVGERAKARATLGIAAGSFVTVYVGRLIGWKRVDLLITAWAGLDEQDRGELLIVGDGPEGQRLRALARGIRGVRFEGLSRRPLAYLWAADVFANASGVDGHQGEGLSVSLLEAMAVGVPPIVTGGPGNDVLVEDGLTGLSFPVSDMRALEDRLRRMRDRELRQRLGREARERVRERYSITAVAGQVEAMYRGH